MDGGGGWGSSGHVLVPEADVVGAEAPAVVVGVEVVGKGEDAPDQRVIDAGNVNSISGILFPAVCHGRNSAFVRSRIMKWAVYVRTRICDSRLRPLQLAHIPSLHILIASVLVSKPLPRPSMSFLLSNNSRKLSSPCISTLFIDV